MDREEKALRGLFLFRGIPEETLGELLPRLQPEHRIYRRGELLCDPEHPPRALVLLLKGGCDVVRPSREGGVTLNSLVPGSCFGVVSLFSRRETYPTRVIARRETEALLLSRGQVERLMAECPAAAMNLIAFLTDRVEFLNDRVATLTEPSVERKLAAFLVQRARTEGAEELPFNRLRTAKALDCGRASLYRALDSLTERGLISCGEKSVTLLDLNELERMILK